MITATLLSLLLTQDSALTVSPVGFSYHVSSLQDYATNNMPNKIYRISTSDGQNHPLTWHPEFNLTYKTKWMQYSAFYMQDSFGRHAGGLLLGPKFNLFTKHISLGLIGGLYVREYGIENNSDFGKKLGPVQLVPMGGPTLSLSYPITKHLSIESNTMGNPVVIHSTIGLRWDLE